jgi:hypothetical protein
MPPMASGSMRVRRNGKKNQRERDGHQSADYESMAIKRCAYICRVHTHPQRRRVLYGENWLGAGW